MMDTPTSEYYAPDGTKINAEDWTRIRTEHPELWRVGIDEVADASVSTVWLGLDHRYTDDGPPMIYETLVSARHTERIERYSIRDEAIAGHAALVKWVKRTVWRRRIANRLLRIADRVGGEHYIAGL